MNRMSLIAAAALAAASLSTYAVEGREVRADRNASTVNEYTLRSTTDAAAPVLTPTGALSRDEVKAELRDLKSAGLYDSLQEASPTPLEDADRTAKLSMIQEREQLSRSSLSQQDLVAMADRPDEAPVIVVVPEQQSQPMDSSGALPFDHPAVRDGTTPNTEPLPAPAQ